MTPPPPPAKCHLIGGLFANLIQASLAVVCIITLIIKRQQEVPQREWKVWFLDVMKQGLGSSFSHFSNIFLSVIIASKVDSGDECQWYCFTYIIDSVLGTVINISLLYIFERLLLFYPFYNEHYCHYLVKFGDYGDPPQLSIWFPQLILWLIIVIISKILILSIVIKILKPIDDLVSKLFYFIQPYPQLELILVMIFVPGVLNVVQFWITDTVLKSGGSVISEDHVNDIEHKHELLANDSDDDSNFSAKKAMKKKTLNTTNIIRKNLFYYLNINNLYKKFTSAFTPSYYNEEIELKGFSTPSSPTSSSSTLNLSNKENSITGGRVRQRNNSSILINEEESLIHLARRDSKKIDSDMDSNA